MLNVLNYVGLRGKDKREGKTNEMSSQWLSGNFEKSQEILYRNTRRSCLWEEGDENAVPGAWWPRRLLIPVGNDRFRI